MAIVIIEGFALIGRFPSPENCCCYSKNLSVGGHAKGLERQVGALAGQLPEVWIIWRD